MKDVSPEGPRHESASLQASGTADGTVGQHQVRRASKSLRPRWLWVISVIFTIPEDQLQVVLAKAAARQTLEVDPLRELRPPDHLISSLPAASVGLIGIVKKNAIVMIDFALAAEGTEGTEGKNSYDSIVEPSLLRFRPILVTTMAALLGALPLALGTRTGSELRRPLGITIIGGLVASQLLMLYTTPVVYLYLDGVQQWLARRRHASRDRV